jgi:Zn-finger nucleic acid-binding protein
MSGTDPEILRCPGCGAPAAAHASRCEYCHAPLARVSCPFCFKMLFEGAAFCPHCGTARSRTEPIDEKSTPCPACKGRMHWVKVGATDLLECEGCDGTWLEASAFERLCADRESQSGMISREASLDARPEPARVAGPAQIHYRPCPRCKKLMNRINFARLSGTVIDVCKGHGTFLDRGELHQVVRFILDGGLDRLRRVEREELIEEQRRLVEIQRALLDRFDRFTS